MQLKPNKAKTKGRTVSSTKIVTVRMPVELADKARQLAESEGSSVSGLVEELVSRAVKQKGRKTA
jgi:hypothetical protein